MKKQITKYATRLVTLGMILAPSLVLAVLNTPAPPVPGGGLTGTGLQSSIETAVQILLAVSVVIGVGAFVYGAIQYFALNKEKEGKTTMFRAIVGIALILGIGLILNTIAGFIGRGLNVG